MWRGSSGWLLSDRGLREFWVSYACQGRLAIPSVGPLRGPGGLSLTAGPSLPPSTPSSHPPPSPPLTHSLSSGCPPWFTCQLFAPFSPPSVSLRPYIPSVSLCVFHSDRSVSELRFSLVSFNLSPNQFCIKVNCCCSLIVCSPQQAIGRAGFHCCRC